MVIHFNRSFPFQIQLIHWCVGVTFTCFI